MNKDLKIKHGFTLAEVFSVHPKDGRKHAFTLAEVLITLGIIGVVAAMTMPTLIQKQREKQTVARLKSTYSILSQAYQRAIQENGTPDTWGLIGWRTGDQMTAAERNNTQKTIDENFFKYLKTTEICKDGSTKCNLDIKYKFLNGEDYVQFRVNTNPAYIAARLANGSLVYIIVQSGTCREKWGSSLKLQNICAGMYVDINGFKGPNQVGIDFFNFVLTKYGIVPGGDINFTRYMTFDAACRDKTLGLLVGSFPNGSGCAAWVMANENMDYLHCDDLSWGGKHKCSD